MVCLLASRRAQIFLIQLLDGRIVMGLPKRLRRVIVIQYLRPDGPNILKIAHIRMYLGLAAAVYTSARTAHDLDKVIICLPCADFFQDLLQALFAYMEIHFRHKEIFRFRPVYKPQILRKNFIE